MKTLGFKSIAAVTLLISGMVVALAQTDVAGDRARMLSGGQGRDAQRTDGRGFHLPENSGFGANSENYARGNGNDQQRPGRMSPEDRRTLRRQIDEAGHDIYAPRR